MDSAAFCRRLRWLSCLLPGCGIVSHLERLLKGLLVDVFECEFISILFRVGCSIIIILARAREDFNGGLIPGGVGGQLGGRGQWFRRGVPH